MRGALGSLLACAAGFAACLAAGCATEPPRRPYPEMRALRPMVVTRVYVLDEYDPNHWWACDIDFLERRAVVTAGSAVKESRKAGEKPFDSYPPLAFEFSEEQRAELSRRLTQIDLSGWYGVRKWGESMQEITVRLHTADGQEFSIGGQSGWWLGKPQERAGVARLLAVVGYTRSLFTHDHVADNRAFYRQLIDRWRVGYSGAEAIP